MSPTSLEQIFHTFAKEQTGATSDEQGVYNDSKEKELQRLFEAVEAEALELKPLAAGNEPTPEVNSLINRLLTRQVTRDRFMISACCAAADAPTSAPMPFVDTTPGNTVPIVEATNRVESKSSAQV